ncbi:MAG TPA: hypothetical protein VFN51_03020 [Candidatus Saccharimonadales bacterium]|nr:hypothetical protein [Candidatus Saccharimonadales bacterium]
MNYIYKVETGVEKIKTNTKKYIYGVIATATIVAGASGATFAAGVNQYYGPTSSSGYCHGAFANTNGNFGTLGTDGTARSIGGGVPAGTGAAGYNNSAVSGDCTLPN